MNSPRDFVKEICDEEGIALDILSHGYVLRLTKNDTSRQVFGSYWDLNSAAADRIACDKTACYSLLRSSQIPAIPHVLMFNPQRRAGWSGEEGTWTRALHYFEANNQKMVVKPNQGTKGESVYYCDSIPALEAAVQAIFMTQPDAALSPYQEIETEYRVFYLNGKCRYAYGKTKGDSWQHNLSQGATAFEISKSTPEDKKKLARLENLASRAASCIGINFATIDIAESAEEKLEIMEINSGVQARQLLEQLPHLQDTIKQIYADAINSMWP